MCIPQFSYSGGQIGRHRSRSEFEDTKILHENWLLKFSPSLHTLVLIVISDMFIILASRNNLPIFDIFYRILITFYFSLIYYCSIIHRMYRIYQNYLPYFQLNSIILLRNYSKYVYKMYMQHILQLIEHVEMTYDLISQLWGSTECSFGNTFFMQYKKYFVGLRISSGVFSCSLIYICGWLGYGIKQQCYNNDEYVPI